MSSEAVLTARDLGISFGNLKAVDGISLDLKPGEIMGLVGPNGSGKTTLVNLVSGLYRPDRGEVRLGGRKVTGLAPHHLARLGLNRTFQVPKPFHTLTVRENVELAAFYTRQEPHTAEKALEFTELAPLADRLAGSLNVGQQKLLDLARALATGPRILLVDELGAGLGPMELDQVAAKLLELAGTGVALLVVEHLLAFLNQLTSRVLVMNAGTRIFEGKLAAAAEDPLVVEVFLGG
ncbi:MAG: ABC transporter ATP-binding protein [Peptococcaceae bacterium]|jgi:branched-chain amino acid transport system ATP-binding protein|nr:ABC transporter ATP-binding protein [Peptococcaceae bacterium]